MYSVCNPSKPLEALETTGDHVCVSFKTTRGSYLCILLESCLLFSPTQGGPTNLLACMCVWLFTSMDQSTAELVTEMMGSGSVQWRGWTLADLTLLIAVYLIHSSSSTFNLFLLFEYFDPVSS